MNKKGYTFIGTVAVISVIFVFVIFTGVIFESGMQHERLQQAIVVEKYNKLHEIVNEFCDEYCCDVNDDNKRVW